MVCCWDASTAEEVARLPDEHSDGLGLLAEFSRDGRLLVLGGFGGEILVIDIEKLIAGEDPLVRQITAHDAIIVQLRLSPRRVDGRERELE